MTAQRWNARHASARATGSDPGPPASVLLRAEPWLPERGVALDLACGRGANALWLAARGLQVLAWDWSSMAIEALREQPGADAIRAEVRDVVADPPVANSCDLIVISRFLDRASCPSLAAALVPGGVLCYQTFTRGLANPDYLLQPNELLTLFPTLDVRWYHEPAVDDPAERLEARLIAQRRADHAP